MLFDLSGRQAVLVSSLAWFGVSVAAGWWASRWPAERVSRTGPVTTLRRWEGGGRWWQRHLRVRSWKERVPEAGGLFGGVAKRKLPSRATEDLELFRRETIRGERVHWLIAASTPLHALWCDPGLFAAMVAFGVVFSAPFIVIQRANRGRLDRLIARRRSSSAPAGAAVDRRGRAWRSRSVGGGTGGDRWHPSTG